MLSSLVMARAGASPSILDAERDFAALAQRAGQWTAFRATAAPDAILLSPEPVRVLEALRDKQDPPRSATWQPSAAFLSCDGTAGATMGPWQRPTSVGYFATIWTRQARQWRWKVDMGDSLEAAWPPAPADVKIKRASCSRPNRSKLPHLGRLPKMGRGSSTDRSLEWVWWSTSKDRSGLKVFLWNGTRYTTVIDKTLGAK